MGWQFTKHYTRDEARALLPQIRLWLEDLINLHNGILQEDQEMGVRLSQGHDLGGPAVNRWLRALLQVRLILSEFQNREIQIKDLRRGLIDFPAFVGGQEVFLCWEKDEPDIEFWHELDSGYAGRERL
jgi:hypothetical protein